MDNDKVIDARTDTNSAYWTFTPPPVHGTAADAGACAGEDGELGDDERMALFFEGFVWGVIAATAGWMLLRGLGV